MPVPDYRYGSYANLQLAQKQDCQQYHSSVHKAPLSTAYGVRHGVAATDVDGLNLLNLLVGQGIALHGDQGSYPSSHRDDAELRRQVPGFESLRAHQKAVAKMLLQPFYFFYR